MKVLLFDLGQTLIENVSINLVNGFFALFGEFLTKEELETEFIGIINEFNRRSERELMIMDFVNDIASRYHIDLGKDSEKRLLDATEVDKSIEGINEVLTYLKAKGYYLGVISNTIFSGNVMQKRLIDLGYNNVFHFVLTSADVTYRKPFKEIFQKAYEIVKEDLPNVKIEDLYFVGDNYEIDVLGSMAAGMKPIWLNSQKQMQDYQCLMIESLQSLKDLVDKNMIN